jgi:DNA-binding CsgD family transcriptional regulator
MAATVLPIVVRITGVANRLDIAEAAVVTVLSSPSVATNMAMSARLGAAMIAVIRGDISSAMEHYAVLIHERGRTLAQLSIDRLLGLLAQTMGRLEDAVGHFEEALAFCQREGCRPEYAWSACDYTDVLLQRNSSGDREKAASLLDESLALSQELNMRPLIERLTERLDWLATQPPARQAYPDGLTEREVEVLILVAQGKSNREIADDLFISTRTVSTHVTNILNKTNTANRTEAARYASQHKLV